MNNDTPKFLVHSSDHETYNFAYVHDGKPALWQGPYDSYDEAKQAAKDNYQSPKFEGYHRGDPCIYCGLPHDEVPVGDCVGEKTK